MTTRSSYSPRAYRVAVDIRGAKTLMVEGVSDRRIILRSCASKKNYHRTKFVIDTAQIIEATEGESVGNKEKVLEVFELLKESGSFGIFVDREWDGLTDPVSGVWLPYTPANTGEEPKFFTSGHSIENYSFTLDLYRQAILSTCYESVGDNSIPDLESSFQPALDMGLAFSKVFRELGIFGKSKSCVTPDDFSWSGDNQLSINPAAHFCKTLNDRGCNLPEDVVDRILASYSSPDLPEGAPTSFYLHGHLGELVLRASLSSKLRSLGVPDPVSQSYFNERPDIRDMRLREYYANKGELPASIEIVVSFLLAK